MAITRVQIYEELKRKRKLKEFIEPNITITKLTDTLEENDKIEKNGLSLTYLLDPNIHLQINKEIFYKTNVKNKHLIKTYD